MAVKFAISLLVTFSILFCGCTASKAIEKPAAESVENDKAQTPSAPPEVKDPKAEAKGHFALGLMAMNHENWKKAEGHFLDALKLDPDNYNTHMYLARVYEKMKQKPPALEQYKIAISLKPDDPSPYAGLIGVYLDMGLADYAIRTADDAKQKGISEDAFLGNLGWAYYLKEDWDNAEKYFKKDAELHKLDSSPRNNLGLVYYARGRYDDALASFKEASELNKKSLVIPYLMALTYNRLGKEDEVLKSLEEGLKRDRYLEARIPSYNNDLFPRWNPGDLSAAFKKIKEKKN